MLKKIMIGAGLATILATSAMAQSYQPELAVVSAGGRQRQHHT